MLSGYYNSEQHLKRLFLCYIGANHNNFARGIGSTSSGKVVPSSMVYPRIEIAFYTNEQHFQRFTVPKLFKIFFSYIYGYAVSTNYNNLNNGFEFVVIDYILCHK